MSFPERFSKACFPLVVLVAFPLVSRADRLYVSQGNSLPVAIYSTESGQLVSNTTGISLPGPRGLAFDSAGNLYVADVSLNQIEKFAPDGTYVGVFASGNLQNVVSLAFDSAGNLYASSEGTNTIERFSATGVDLGVFASGLNGPAGIAFDGAGNLYVANGLGGTVEKFSANGTDLGHLSSSALTGPVGLAFDSAGNLYVGNYANGQGAGSIEKFSSAGLDLGIFATNLDFPSGLAFDSQGNLYVANGSGFTIEEFSSTGADLGRFTTLAGHPYFLALTDDSGHPLALPPASVPEPTSLAFLLGGGALLTLRRRAPRVRKQES